MKKTWHKAYKLHWQYFHQGPKHFYSGNNWARSSTYMTPKGIIVISEWQHEFREEIRCGTEFEAVVNGRLYRMQVNEIDLAERTLKNIATRFLNECIAKETANG
jgi:hypothetical protein